MSSFVVDSLPAADAPAYVAYNSAVMAAMRQLAVEGQLAESAALDDFIALSARIREQVTAAASRAAGAGAERFTLEVPMSRAEHLMLNAMGPTLQSVMEIATMRGTVDTSPPPAAFRFMRELSNGTFRP